jgi:taurine---2-oxoglutarate transaminase
VLSLEEIARLERDHVLYPWTARQDALKPRVVDSAHGTHFVLDGKEVLDFGSQLVFANVGHTHPRVIEAITKQLHSLPVASSTFANRPRAALAKKLAEITPGSLTKTFFSTGGAEAVEAAAMAAKAFTGRRKIISRFREYHGSTFGAMALSADQRSWPFTPSLPDVVHVPLPYPYRCTDCRPGAQCSVCSGRHIEDVIRFEGHDQVAAVLLEVIPGSNGVVVPPEGYLATVREITRKYGVLLIADEVMTGFGRTGEWFACNHWGLEPDIMTLAKGLTSGYIPLAATVMSGEIAQYFESHSWVHGHTYTGHALAAAAANAVISVYEDEDLIHNARNAGDYLLERASELLDRHPSVGEVRGRGLFIGLELVRSRETKEPLYDWPTGRGAQVKQRVLTKALEDGLYVLGGNANVLVLCPPLTVTRAEIDEAIVILDAALSIADSEFER